MHILSQKSDFLCRNPYGNTVLNPCCRLGTPDLSFAYSFSSGYCTKIKTPRLPNVPKLINCKMRVFFLATSNSSPYFKPAFTGTVHWKMKFYPFSKPLCWSFLVTFSNPRRVSLTFPNCLHGVIQVSVRCGNPIWFETMMNWEHFPLSLSLSVVAYTQQLQEHVKTGSCSCCSCLGGFSGFLFFLLKTWC